MVARPSERETDGVADQVVAPQGHDALSGFVLIAAWSLLLGPLAVMAVLVVFNALQHSLLVGASTALFVVGVGLLWWYRGRTRRHGS